MARNWGPSHTPNLTPNLAPVPDPGFGPGRICPKSGPISRANLSVPTGRIIKYPKKCAPRFGPDQKNGPFLSQIWTPFSYSPGTTRAKKWPFFRSRSGFFASGRGRKKPPRVPGISGPAPRGPRAGTPRSGGAGGRKSGFRGRNWGPSQNPRKTGFLTENRGPGHTPRKTGKSGPPAETPAIPRKPRGYPPGVGGGPPTPPADLGGSPAGWGGPGAG